MLNKVKVLQLYLDNYLIHYNLLDISVTSNSKAA